MTPSGQLICLCMIVKDEAHVIARCIKSVESIVDHYVFVDTGSTDNTKNMIDYICPGYYELFERPWVDFAHNRTEALNLADGMYGCDYTLIIDADDELVFPPGFTMPDLDADAYTFAIADAGVAYRRPQLVRASLPWRYRGVLHEFLTCDQPYTTADLGISMKRNTDGARHRDPETYHKDAEVLKAALEEETDPFMRARYTFYLAQSYRDCGENQKAIQHYLDRADMGFWDQEVYCSLLYAGRLMEAENLPFDSVRSVYDLACETIPDRAEALHALSRLCRLDSDYEMGSDMGDCASGIDQPADGLFIEGWIYDYGALDEYSINAFWDGDPVESLAAIIRAFRKGRIPPHELSRICDNADWSIKSITKALGDKS